MKKQRDERKDIHVITRHGTATPERLKQPVMLDAPGWQVCRPSGVAFDLNFNVAKIKLSSRVHASIGSSSSNGTRNVRCRERRLTMRVFLP